MLISMDMVRKYSIWVVWLVVENVREFTHMTIFHAKIEKPWLWLIVRGKDVPTSNGARKLGKNDLTDSYRLCLISGLFVRKSIFSSHCFFLTLHGFSDFRPYAKKLGYVGIQGCLFPTKPNNQYMLSQGGFTLLFHPSWESHTIKHNPILKGEDQNRTARIWANHFWEPNNSRW